jgi:hypothetical protein
MISGALTLLTNAVIAYNTWKLHQVLERAAEKPASLFRATRFWRTSPLLPSDTSTFRAFIAFRWSAILVGFYRQYAVKRSPPERNDLSTGNRYFWRVSVNTPGISGIALSRRRASVISYYCTL